MSEKKKILYVQTSGVDTPERLYVPFILAPLDDRLLDADVVLSFYREL